MLAFRHSLCFICVTFRFSKPYSSNKKTSRLFYHFCTHRDVSPVFYSNCRPCFQSNICQHQSICNFLPFNSYSYLVFNITPPTPPPTQHHTPLLAMSIKGSAVALATMDAFGRRLPCPLKPLQRIRRSRLPQGDQKKMNHYKWFAWSDFSCNRIQRKLLWEGNILRNLSENWLSLQF